MMYDKIVSWMEMKTWRLYSVAFFAGALGTLAFEPFSWWGLIFISIWGLLWLLNNFNKVNLHCSFMLGWWYGLGHFTTGLYWIAFAFGIDLKQFGWLIPFTILGLPAILSLFIACVTFLTKLTNTEGFIQACLFSALWTIFEWLRGHILTGLPWNLLAYVWMDNESINQCLSIFGAYGLSLITVFCASLLYFQLKAQSLKQGVPYTILSVLILLSLLAFGTQRLSKAKNHTVSNLYLRLIQPNIPQKLKWKPEIAERNFDHIIALTKSPSDKPITHILWPESAIPFMIETDDKHRQAISNCIPSGGLILMGGVRFNRYLQGNIQVWNSIFVIDSNARILTFYDKSHLVPFGEYIPMRSLFPSFVKKVTAGSIDYSAGTGPRTIALPGLPSFSPLVCYEGIFPGNVKEFKGERPQWIYNATNDAWYGPTSGPYQHLAINRARAIEEGLPYMRVANTGISAVIDAYGRIQASLPLDTQGVIDTPLPFPSPSPTLYSLYGDSILMVLIILMLLPIIAYLFIRNKTVFIKKQRAFVNKSNHERS